LEPTKQKSTLLQNSTAKMWALLIALTAIVLLIISAGNTHAQTPTKRVTITELEAKKALRYKADAEFFFQQSVTKDSIISTQDTIIKKQKNRIFGRGLIIAGETLIIVLLTLQIAAK
jgi:hypothetical protein